MKNHSLVKTGLGVGLMAASAGAMADLHTFAEPMLYYKLTGAVVNYEAFLPTIAGNTAGVVLLDLYQSGTISTWAYGVGGAVGSAAGGTAWAVSAFSSDATLYASTVDVQGVKFQTTSSGYTAAFSTWYGGDTASVGLSFSNQQLISSQACNVSFSAVISTDDYLKFASFSIQPSDWPTASDSVSWRTKTGTTAEDTSSIGSAAWNAYNASATTAFSTFSAFSIPAAGNSTATYAASQITKFNLCTTAYTTRNALNSSGNTIGGKAGLMRLW